MQPRIAADLLRSLLRYEAETGLLFWLERPAEMFAAAKHAAVWNARYARKEAFTSLDRHGYRQGNIFDHVHRGHRVAWALHYGEWPKLHIDHINGNRSDNRLANLREASCAENNRNVRPASNSSSRFLGVSLDRTSNKWTASIRVDGRKVHIGRFADETEAAKAYDLAASKYYGVYARPNLTD